LGFRLGFRLGLRLGFRLGFRLVRKSGKSLSVCMCTPIGRSCRVCICVCYICEACANLPTNLGSVCSICQVFTFVGRSSGTCVCYTCDACANSPSNLGRGPGCDASVYFHETCKVHAKCTDSWDVQSTPIHPGTYAYSFLFFSFFPPFVQVQVTPNTEFIPFFVLPFCSFCPGAGAGNAQHRVREFLLHASYREIQTANRKP